MTDEAAAIGVDIGGTNLRVARVSASGHIEAALTERITRDPLLVRDRIVDLVERLATPRVLGLGVGVPERVDSASRRVLSGGFLDLRDADVAAVLEDRFGKPVALDTDCNMALLAEMAFGAARGCAHVVMLTIGTGIGGAIALEGSVLRGRASAGQLGHITVAHAGLPCACGRRGCVETTSSGTALGRLIAEAEADLPPGTRVEALLEAASSDAVSARIIAAWVGPLQDAIDSLVAMADPELVLLGGGLGAAAFRGLQGFPARSSWYTCPVAAADLGDDAGVIGAAMAGMRQGRH